MFPCPVCSAEREDVESKCEQCGWSPVGQRAPGSDWVETGPETPAGTPRRRAELGSVVSLAYHVWSNNLKLLVPLFAFLIVVSTVISMSSDALTSRLGLQEGALLKVLIDSGESLASSLIQLYLGIGATMIMLTLARGKRASFSVVFQGGPHFLRVLAGTVLFCVGVFLAGVLIVGALLMIGLNNPALLILAMLLAVVVAFTITSICLVLYWPYYYLLIDTDVAVLRSFTEARTMTKGNRLTTVLIWLTSVAITIVFTGGLYSAAFVAPSGLIHNLIRLALLVLSACIAPFVSAMWASAYLHISGQFPLDPTPRSAMEAASSG